MNPIFYFKLGCADNINCPEDMSCQDHVCTNGGSFVALQSIQFKTTKCEVINLRGTKVCTGFFKAYTDSIYKVIKCQICVPRVTKNLPKFYSCSIHNFQLLSFLPMWLSTFSPKPIR